MAHWSSGYADFHEELYAKPPGPPAPLQLRCPECPETFPELAELREHVLLQHPISRPVLLHRGRMSGDARLLVQRATTPAEWATTNCTRAQVNGIEVPIANLSVHLAGMRGVVDVLLGNDRSERRFEFDFAVATDEDLRGVDEALVHLIEDGDITSSSISRFFERAQVFPTARNYAGGVAEYLYWFAARGTTSNLDTDARNRDKLNRAAHLLGDVERPAAYAITSLISFHFNHFGDAERRALSPRLRAVCARLDEMLRAAPRGVGRSGIDGEPAHLERLLMDDRTAELVALCSLPLDRATTDKVTAFDTAALNSYDRFKVILFSSEHHLVTGDPRAAQLVRTAGQNGLPERWVNTRLDLVTTEGPTCQTTPATTTPARGRAAQRVTGTGIGTETPRPTAGRRSTATATSSRNPSNQASPTREPAPQRSTTTDAPKQGATAATRTEQTDPKAPRTAAGSGSATTTRTATTSVRQTPMERTSLPKPPGPSPSTVRSGSAATANGPGPTGTTSAPHRTGGTAPTPNRAGSMNPVTGNRTHSTARDGATATNRGRPAATTGPGVTNDPTTANQAGSQVVPTTPPVSNTPPWESHSTLIPPSGERAAETEPHNPSWWNRLLPWWK